MNKREMVVTLQTNLMNLAQAIIQNKGRDNLLMVDKNEFSKYNNQFKTLISKLPDDFYLVENNNSHTDEIIELSNKINCQIDTLNNTLK